MLFALDRSEYKLKSSMSDVSDGVKPSPFIVTWVPPEMEPSFLDTNEMAGKNFTLK
jgi:hypothetical protein